MLNKNHIFILILSITSLLTACTRPASSSPLVVSTVFPTATVEITPVTPALPELTVPPAPTTAPASTETAASVPTPAFPELAGLLTRGSNEIFRYSDDGYAQIIPQLPPILRLAANDRGVFLYSYQDDIYRYTPGDGEPLNLSSTPDRVEIAPTWLPGDSQNLLCLSSVLPQPGEQFPYYLTRIGPPPDDYEILDPNLPVGAFSISPDGHQVALNGGRIYDMDTGVVQTFTAADYGLLDPVNLRLSAPAWSPDGRWIAWSAGYMQDSGVMESTVLINLDLGAAFTLPFYRTVAYDGLSPAPLWSPDGSFLAIDVHAEDYPTAGVWIYPTGGAPGAEFRLETDLSSAVGQDWAWSPDGAKLAVSPDGPYVDGIYLFETGDWTPQEYAAPGSVLGWLE